MMPKILCAAAAYTLLSAGDTPAETPFKTHTELSFIQTQGNTKSASFALGFDAGKQWHRHLFKSRAAALYSTEAGAETKNKWNVDLTYGYRFTGRFSLDYLFSYAEDKFSGYDSQLYTGPGLSYAALTGPVHTLGLTVSAGYARDDVAAAVDANGTVTGAGEVREYTSGKAEFNYAWQVRKGFRFLQEASYRVSFDDGQDYFVLSKTAVESKINSFFSMGMSYKVDYKNRAPEGKERTDTTLMASLIIDY